MVVFDGSRGDVSSSKQRQHAAARPAATELHLLKGGARSEARPYHAANPIPPSKPFIGAHHDWMRLSVA